MKIYQLALVPCLLFVLFSIAVKPAAAFQGSNGSDGIAGLAGDPGSDGSDGENGEGEFIHVPGWQIFNIVQTWGGTGGTGGDGGNGMDGFDFDQSADGGNGGGGGAGGFATSSWNAKVRVEDYGPRYRHATTIANGGMGGDGGQGGLGQNSGSNGRGGNGGNGGFAFSNATGELQIVSHAQGGGGGIGYGSGSRGGDGGSAAANGFGISNNPNDIRDHELAVRQFGGRGGDGFDGADGGNGGHSLFGNDNSTLGMRTVSEDQFVELRAIGGNAGNSYNGNTGGRGGNANLDFDHIAAGINSATTGKKEYRFEITGGNGGIGTASSEQVVNGGQAGWAALQAQEAFSITSSFSRLEFKLTGGRGGNADGNMNAGHGANGGVVAMDPMTILDGRANAVINSAPLAIETLDLELKGGDAGSAFGTGNGGHGASANLANKLTLGAGVGRLNLRAVGGQGGFGTVGGDGGDAVTVVDHAFENPSITAWTFNLSSIGGKAGGSRTLSTDFSTGGDAYTMLYRAGNGDTTAEVFAAGGMSVLGRSGNATARGTTVVFGENDYCSVRSEAYGTTTDAPTGLTANYGTSANAQATAVNYGQGIAKAESRANASFGLIESGFAFSIATARNHGLGTATSLAVSSAQADRQASTPNNAKSVAVASSLTGQSTAISNARVIGHFNSALARSHIEDIGGIAISSASTQTITRPMSGVASTELNYLNGSLAIPLSTSSQISYRQSELKAFDGFEAVNHVIIDPHPTGVDDFVADNSLIRNTFQNGDNAYWSNVVGLGTFHSGYADTPIDGLLTIDSQLDLSVRLDDRIHTDQHMLFGLFDPQFTGAGFDLLEFSLAYENDTLVDESFTDVASALTYFDDQILELEYLPDGTSLNKDLFVNFSLTTSGEFDSFGFNFIFGDASLAIQQLRGRRFANLSSVPEPSSLFVLWISGMTMFCRRKRRRLRVN